MGPTIFRHNKEIARGVQSLCLSSGVLSTCQCTATCHWAWKHAGRKHRRCASLQTMSAKPLWE